MVIHQKGSNCNLISLHAHVTSLPFNQPSIQILCISQPPLPLSPCPGSGPRPRPRPGPRPRPAHPRYYCHSHSRRRPCAVPSTPHPSRLDPANRTSQITSSALAPLHGRRPPSRVACSSKCCRTLWYFMTATARSASGSLWFDLVHIDLVADTVYAHSRQHLWQYLLEQNIYWRAHSINAPKVAESHSIQLLPSLFSPSVIACSIPWCVVPIPRDLYLRLGRDVRSCFVTKTIIAVPFRGMEKWV